MIDVKRILLPGKHNIENYMAAIAAVKDLVSKDSICKVAETFGGVEHRIELIRELNGVKYYNSSIDSSPARTTACLRSFSNKIIMIAGGYDKKLDYTALGKEICEHVKLLILCGATSEKIKKAVESVEPAEIRPRIILCPDFMKTASLAREHAVRGDCVVLTPASASFDLFRNFEERGKTFKKIVLELNDENNRE
jgi:UDP-N-acetylmuramoylalanine--D-glutamate ligase